MTAKDEWTADRLLEVRDQFVANRSIENAIAILEKLLPTEAGDLDMDTWQPVKDLISAIFSTIPADMMLDSHQILLLQALNNAPDRVVDWIALNYLLPAIGTIEQRLRTSAKAVTIALTRRVRGVACAESLAKILWRFVDLPEVKTELLNQIQQERNSEKRFRLHDVTKMALMQPGFRDRHAELSELIDAMLHEMEVDDLLVRMSALDLLADVAASHPSNSQYFHSQGQLDKIYKLLANAENDPDGGILYTGCVRFFGYLSASDPNCLRNYPIFTKSVMDMINHFDCLDPARRVLAFDTLAVVASTSEAKAFLNEPSEANPLGMRKIMNHFGAAIASGPVELRTRHVDALSTLMGSSKNEKDAAILREWFAELGGPFPKMLLDFLEKPFEDLRVATYRLLIALFHHEWAVLRFFSVAGFADWIVQRGNDSSAQGTQLKYDLICRALETNPTGLDAVECKRLEQYRAQGAYYAEKPPQLAMEGA
ncbi:Protein F35G12.12 [Aphelenchoides avenae]|nr:Protein F35G12.12 [Aphelenchus avenae]